jgi:hypothetical protein
MSPEEEEAFMHYLRFKKARVPGKGLGHGGPKVSKPDSLSQDEAPKTAKQ